MTKELYPAASTETLLAFVGLQRAAARAAKYHDNELAEAIMHHCALKVASATAPSDYLVGKLVEQEIQAKHRLLRMAVPDLEGIAVRGRYLKALSAVDEWERDAGTVDALITGMVGAVRK